MPPAAPADPQITSAFNDVLTTAIAALASLPTTAWIVLLVGLGLPCYLWVTRRVQQADAAGFTRAESLARAHVDLLTERLEQRGREAERIEEELRLQLTHLQHTLSDESATRAAAEASATELRVRLETTAAAMTAREELLRSNAETLREQFAAMSREAIERQGQAMAQLSESRLGQVLAPFKEQVGEFKRRVDEIHHLETQERATLLNEVKTLQSASAAVNAEAANLTRALKGDKRTQGQWGELVLERLLQSSGLTEGREYVTQLSVTEDDGQVRRPDVVVRLPDDKDVVIDAKVSLTAFERLTHGLDKKDEAVALRAHLTSLKTHIKDLAGRSYDELKALRSLDFVLLFVPVEGALSRALEAEPELFEDALRQRVMLVSPSTLLLSLRVINNLWRNDKQHRNARDIADRAGAIYDKVRLLAEDVDQMSRQVEQLERLLHSARGRLVDGRGNLVRQIEQVRDLGARIKVPLPKPLQQEAEVSHTGEAASEDATV